MFKFVLGVSLGICCADATIMQVPSTSIDAKPFYQDILGDGTFLGGSPAVRTSVFPVHCVVDCIPAFASGGFIDDYILTITGGTGQGSFIPCLFAGPTVVASEARTATASFGTLRVSNGSQPTASCVQPFGNCGQQVQLPQTPFTFGIPQTFTVSLGVDENIGGSVIADLWGFQFFDAFGSPITNAHFTLVSVPEPSALSLLSIGVMFLLAVAFGGAFTYEPGRVGSRFYRTQQKPKKSCRSTA